MKYEDVLATRLDRLRRGETIDALVGEHPRFAEQLRNDLTTAASTRTLSARLPATSSDARTRFQRDLYARRRAVASKPHRGGWFRLSLTLPVLAATAAAVLAIAVLAGGVFAPASTAEASIEGIVIENDGTTMTVQTELGLQTVSLNDTSSVVGGNGGSLVSASSVEPGQLIVIRATREAAILTARRIELQAATEVAGWCDRLPAQCAEVERLLAQRAERCDQNPVLCQRIDSRLQQIRGEIASRNRLSDLRTRCEQGTAVACRELQNACQSDRPACGPVRDFLRNRPQR